MLLLDDASVEMDEFLLDKSGLSLRKGSLERDKETSPKKRLRVGSAELRSLKLPGTTTT